ncbi:MAG: c-type cytochrome [Bacteroidetes bacterium]|nr:c-type cytochrome [Bacteroidota bacterium]
MVPYKKLYAGGILLVFLTVGIAATNPPEEEEGHYKNLKVLPKKISEDDMERVMAGFQRQLGVTCMYCHMPAKSETDLNFDSDEKKEKIIAREMLKMTLQLNKKYFNRKIDKRILTKPVVWCRTCHRGFPRPWR